jgi:hypothetical protein
MSVLEQYFVVGDNDADGDSVYLYCKRCPNDGPVPDPGDRIARFQTNPGDDPPTVCTLQDLFRAAREHDAEFHEGGATGAVRGSES